MLRRVDFIVLDDAPRPPGRPRKPPAPRKVERQRVRSRMSKARAAGKAPDPRDLQTLEDTDLAVMVVKQTKAGLSSGDLTPTVKDGIAAQGILERRAERAADREFMLNLARALAGGGQQAPQVLLPDPAIIEGEVREVYAPSVPPRTDADDADLDADLAPAHLRQG